MVVRVLDNVRAAHRVDDVVVATDDERIAAIVRAAGGEAVLTDPALPSGSDRTQRAVASAIAGHAPLVIAVGPAGTGKTTALRPAFDVLRQHDRAVFGLAPSATAAGTQAVDFADAVASAIKAVESAVPGARVVEVHREQNVAAAG